MPVARSTAVTAAIVVVLGLAAGFGAACSRSPLDGDPGPSTAAAGGDAVPPIELADNFEATMWKLDPYTIASASIAADTLHVLLSHGGGCATHRFTLAASRAFRESNPVQVSAVLTHDAGGDMCRALLTKELRFNLAPLKAAYREAYRTTSGAIVIHLWHQGTTLRYEF